MKFFQRHFFKIILVSIFFLLICDVSSQIIVDWLWFQKLGYLSIFIKQRLTQIFLGVFAFGISSLFFWVNLSLADKQRWQWSHEQGWIKNSQTYLPGKTPLAKKYSQIILLDKEFVRQKYLQQKPVLKLSFLLPIILLGTFTLTFLIIYYSDIVFEIWRQKDGLNITIEGFKNVIDKENFLLFSRYWWLLLFTLITIAGTLFKTKFTLKAIAFIISTLFTLIISGNWLYILAYLQPTSFNYNEAQFGRDISFYIFAIPVLNLISLWATGLFSSGLIIVFLRYLLSGNSLSEGKFPGFSLFQIRHLFLLGGMEMLGMSLHHWLNRYQLLYSERGVVYGAGFTDVAVKLPIESVLSILASAIAIWLFVLSILKKSQLTKKSNQNLLQKQWQRKFTKILIILFPVVFYLSLIITGGLGSSLIQRFRVQPNELAAETPYLSRNIEMTRKAFNLDEIEAQTFNPQGELTATSIAKNNLTIDNIRLWDTRPILATNRQLQQIRLYYEFLDADIDRYIFKLNQQDNKQQVIISARELDYNAVPQRAKTWVNQHLIYTHGYGFTLSPVNQVDKGGLPFYYVKDIGAASTETGSLTVSSQAIRDSIPLKNPRIYYGELTNNYIMTKTKVRELDYPSGEENVYNTYDGKGGISLKNYGLRLVFAQYLQDWQMLFTRNFTPETKVLIRRNITQRVAKIAPWLRYDKDPYLVVADTSTIEKQKDDHLYWIIDGYTISDRFPYSDPGSNNFNYIRNSVKVLIDAYDGDVNFYIADLNDPIIQTWNKVFPQLFKTLAEMPASLRTHIRYPEDFFSIQSERLLSYHMIDPQVFYNREDQWQISQEIYGLESKVVDPYYLIMRLPTAKTEEFILLHPYTPTSRPNLIAWLAARCDGDNYGKLLLYKFPKQKLVYGTNQIEALINQDPIISQQISLWTREGSKAIQGNLLIIPIEQSLLYVEPLYLEASQNSLPILARVIVVYENQIVMAETLDNAIAAIFQPEQSDNSTIIRPVETLDN